jgi:hypothetical protein
LEELCEKNQGEDLIIKQHKLHFTTWLKDLNIPLGETEEEKIIHLLTSGPYNSGKSWQTYDINGCTFYTVAGQNPPGSSVSTTRGAEKPTLPPMEPRGL